MDFASGASRHIRIGDDDVSCVNIEQELHDEIVKLKAHIACLQTKGSLEPRQLRHLRKLLLHREAVLNWLQSEKRP
ncbi:hypothetical protein G8764_07060 [Pseudomaricurvus alcaniphilus]|uniref:hypothetical protein n=1 Tax=Pseudomaricurvus alcaniphilus TaxID=1166482 RepID=UPI00140DD1DB|nr:hypothetical protein [Pseudomaricurvus alcaniphilus]NHN37045.1 hypothetical protein [Pseudomaricurvus alcaniphilus]